VDDPNDGETFTMRLAQVFFYYQPYFARRDSVQVKDIRDFYLDRFGKGIKIVVLVLHF
jgi:hypothetical protein